MRKLGVSGDRLFSSLRWLSMQQLKHISSDLNRFQTQTNSPSASPLDPPFAPGIELGLTHYTVAMGTLTPPLTKWEPRKAELLIRMCVCECVLLICVLVHLVSTPTCVCLKVQFTIYEQVKIIGHLLHFFAKYKCLIHHFPTLQAKKHVCFFIAFIRKVFFINKQKYTQYQRNNHEQIHK